MSVEAWTLNRELRTSSRMHLTSGKQPTWGVRLVDFAPLLVQELTDASFFRGNRFQLVQAVKEGIAQVRDIRLSLDAQMGRACSATQRSA
ncbi:MAG TPA: hypothetical protein VH591_21410 [Ktedonobacterales bacterium]|jgi:hypothetical protein